MGRYHSKRLKQDAAADTPDAPLSEQDGMAAGTPDAPPCGQDETPNVAQAAADASDAPLSEQDDAPNTAQAAADAPACADHTAPRPKKSKWFLIVLTLYVVILLAVSGGLQRSLWRYLEDSQAEMDRQAAELAARQAYEKALFQAPQLAFEAWQSGLTSGYWTDLWYAKAPSDLDAQEAVQEFMAERFAPDAIQAYKATEFTDETPVYVLKNGEDTLARITLSGSELDWSVLEVELLIEGAYSACVTVADSYHVYCNGKEMGREYTEDAGSRFRYEPLEDQLEGAVTWVSYSVEGLLLEPELTVEPPEGCTAVQAEDGAFLLGMAEDAGAYMDKSVQFVRAYLYYYMRGSSDTQANLNSVLSYLTPGTQAYRDLRNTYSGVIWSTPFSDIDTSKTTAGNVLIWADNCFSVDVAYNADARQSGRHVDYADAVMRIYFLRTDRGYIISNFETL